MSGWTEYYISCNPPLLPSGVKEVIKRATELTGKDLPEILYEPDIPWFKCISLACFKPKIHSVIEGILSEIVEEDVDAIDDEASDDADVAIIADDPRVMPWIAHATSDQYAGLPAECVFPEVIASRRYQTLWRGLESSNQKTSFPQLLAKIDGIFRQSISTSPDVRFEVIDNCRLAANMAASLVYIGADESEQELQCMTTKLDTLLEIYNNTGTTMHATLTSTNGETQLAYRWFSHLNMQRTTYLPTDSNSTADYSKLLGSATVQTMVRSSEDGWVSERNKQLDSHGKLPVYREVHAFRNYQYPTSIHKHVIKHDTPHLSGACDVRSEAVGVREWLLNILRDPTDTLEDGNAETANTDGGIHDLLGDIEPTDQPVTPRVGRHIPLKETPLFEHEDLISFDEISPDNKQKPTTAVFGSTDCSTSLPEHLQNSLYPPEPSAPKGPMAAVDPPKYHGARRIHLKKEPSKFREVEYQIKNLVGALRLLPGEVSLRLKFGRILLSNFPSCRVALGNKPRYPRETVLHYLSNLPPGQVGFTPVLSTNECDVMTLPKIMVSEREGWTLIRSKLYYDFTCYLGADSKDRCTVELDPEAGATARSLQTEVFGAFLHCPSSSWDAKVCGIHSFDMSQKYADWLEPWLKSITVFKSDPGRTRLEFVEQEKDGAVKAVTVRHVQQYRNDSGSSILEVSFHRRLYKGNPKEGVGSDSAITWDMPKVWKAAKKSPDQWVEASIISLATESRFALNRDLKIGSKASWTAGDLEQSGVFEDFCRIGFAMASQMDGIGSTNDNGEALDMTTAYVEPPRESSQYVASSFW